MKRTIVMTWILAGSAGLLLGLGPACDNGGSGSNSIALSAAEDAFYDAFCERLMECPGIMFSYNPFTSADQCRPFLAIVMADEGDDIGNMVAAVQAGRMAYDGAQAKKCLDEFATMACAAFKEGPDTETCETVFTGKVANGQSCTIDQECAGGWCDFDGGCDGTCADEKMQGEDCSQGASCAYGLECENGTCQPETGPPAKGEDCSQDECAYGLYCDDTDKCATLLAADSTCEDMDQCAFGLGCFGGKCLTPEIVAQGQDCDYDTGKICDLVGGMNCARNLADGSTETCRPMAKKGELCINDTDQLMIPCDMFVDLWCDSQGSKKCEALKAGGENCTDDDECASRYCDQGKCYDDGDCG